MSRCYPYPPPGYELSGSRNQALIESIKLLKEKKAKEERKKEKREKKEKKNEKKEKEKIKENKDKIHQTLVKSSSAIIQGPIDQKSQNDKKGDIQWIGKGAETEQSEVSTVTVERGQPVGLHLPSTSSDSTENSNKRKRQTPDASGSHGKIIRIKLSVKKQKEPDDSASDPQLCSTSGRTHVTSQIIDDNICFTSNRTNNVGKGFVPGTHKQQIGTSRNVEAAPVKTRLAFVPDAPISKMQKLELEYKNLFKNWVPPQTNSLVTSEDDIDWLFQGKSQQKLDDTNAEKRLKSLEEDIPCASSSGLYPRAQHLHGVDIYALPFTVPF